MAFFGMQHHMRGGFSMVRTALGSSAPGYEPINFRSPQWFGAALGLTPAQRSLAMQTGQLKYIAITVNSGEIRLAESATPGDQFSGASATGTFATTERLFSNAADVFTLYYTTGASPATFEIYVEFDIPPAT